MAFGSLWCFLIAIFSGLLFACVVLLLFQFRKMEQQVLASLAELPVPFALATEPGFFRGFTRIGEALGKIVQHRDLLFLELSRSRVEALAEEMNGLASGRISFRATETWRTAYQHVLETLNAKVYLSVAWVRSDDYWDDSPGRQSMRFNYELIERGYRIERIHILSDASWPFDEKLPGAGVLDWLIEQQQHGIHVWLVRESDLSNEPDLMCDFAVYGDRATGIQEIDELSRTQSFVLSFDDQNIRQALARWERLKLFSISFQNLMDRLDA